MDVHSLDRYKNTPLHYAALHGGKVFSFNRVFYVLLCLDVDTIVHLLCAGADPTKANALGLVPRSLVRGSLAILDRAMIRHGRSKRWPWCGWNDLSDK